MFKILVEKNFDREMVEDAEIYIEKDRKKYEPVLFSIIEFMKDNNMLLSDLDLLLDKKKYWTMLEAYTLNVDEMSKKLITFLCEKHDKKFLLKVAHINMEYYIEYKQRRLCVLNAIKSYKTFTLYDFISPVLYKVENKYTAYLLPRLIEVIYLYKNLYDTEMASNWEDIYQTIKKLEIGVDIEIENILSSNKNNINEYIASSNPITIKESHNAELNNDKIRNVTCSKKTQIKDLIIDFIKDSDYIYIESEDNIIHIIASNIEKQYEILVNYLSRFITSGISYKKKNMYLPKEYQMKKYNFYLEIPCVKRNREKHFMTIYNNLSYELINYYEKDGIKIADPITQLRFSYIFLWSSIISQKAHGLRYKEFINFVKSTKQYIHEQRKKIDIYTLKKNYMGIFLSLNIFKKMQLIENEGYLHSQSFYCKQF